MKSFLIGPFLFQFLADGDDRGVGLLRVSLDGDEVELGCSREQWDEFVVEAGP